MEWINVNNILPEDMLGDILLHYVHENADTITCLVHTNFGYQLTTREHIIVNKVVDLGDNTITNEKVEHGWKWDCERLNHVRTPNFKVFVDFWKPIELAPLS